MLELSSYGETSETLAADRRLWRVPLALRPYDYALTAILALAALWLWKTAFAPVFRTGFRSDDSFFLAVSPLSLHDVVDWFLVPADESGYYRPMARLLWSLCSALGASEPWHFQAVSIALLLGAGACLFISLQLLHRNAPLAVAGAGAFLLSIVHVKNLFWITLWFHTAAAFFASAVFLCFGLSAQRRQPWARRLGLACLLAAYTCDNAMHCLAVLPLAFDWVYVPRVSGESLLRRGLRVAWYARDHLLLSAVFFLFVYVVGAPLNRIPHNHLSLVDPGNLRAFFGYFVATLWHSEGDGSMPFFWQYPWLIWPVSAALLAMLVGGFLWDRRFLLFLGFAVGTSFVISLLNERWQVEYATPLALAVMGMISAALAGAIELAPARLRVGLSYGLALGWVLVAFYSARVNLPRFAVQYLQESDETSAFVEAVRRLDRATPRGKVFYFAEMDGDALRAAPFAHFVQAGLWQMVPGRAYVFRRLLFWTGEGAGLLTEDGRWVRAYLDPARPFLALRCGPGFCAEMPATGAP